MASVCGGQIFLGSLRGNQSFFIHLMVDQNFLGIQEGAGFFVHNFLLLGSNKFSATLVLLFPTILYNPNIPCYGRSTLGTMHLLQKVSIHNLRGDIDWFDHRGVQNFSRRQRGNQKKLTTGHHKQMAPLMVKK